MARIVVADDTAEIRQLLSLILTDEGHNVSVAPDGRKALELMEGDPPDLLILDVMMPELDGYATLREMKAAGLRDRTKVLMLTAKSSESDWVRAFQLGADGYVTKPFEVDELTDQVREVLSLSKKELTTRRDSELHKARLLSRLESLFDDA